MKIELNKQYAPTLVNLLIQMAMSENLVVRPIAFSVGNGSNVIATNDTVIEDMTEFIHNVCAEQYVGRFSGIAVYNGTVNSVLNTSAFASCGVTCVGSSDVLHTLSANQVTIIFSNANGNLSAEDNIGLLQSMHIDTEQYVVIPSRHNDVKNATFEAKESGNKMIYDFNIETYSGATTEICVKKAKQSLIQILNDL